MTLEGFELKVSGLNFLERYSDWYNNIGISLLSEGLRNDQNRLI